MNNVAVIAAAGTGKRFKGKLPKQYVKVNGTEIIAMAAQRFQSSKHIDAILFVVSTEYIDHVYTNVIKKYKLTKSIGVISGGVERYLSVYNAIEFLKEYKPKNVLIHDGARPVFDKRLIGDVVKGLKRDKAAIPVKAVAKTVKKVKGNYIVSTLNREELRTAETPQGFRFKELSELYTKKKIEKLKPTDEAGVFEKAGYKVRIIEDPDFNIKVTTKEDITVLKAYLK